MTKKIVEKDANVPIPEGWMQIAKDMAVNHNMHSIGVDTILKKFAENTFASEEDRARASIEINELSIACSLDSGHSLLESTSSAYRALALEVRRSLVEEFNCTLPSEKILVEQIVNAYIRKIEYSVLLTQHRQHSVLTHESIAFLSLCSKELDRAFRQLVSALETLKSIKQHPLNVHIKTQNAFVAQNQQNNNHSDQINETK